MTIEVSPLEARKLLSRTFHSKCWLSGVEQRREDEALYRLSFEGNSLTFGGLFSPTCLPSHSHLEQLLCCRRRVLFW